MSNYLNRVVGNRTIGNNIVLQGGVALNKAVPLAFAMLMDKNITIPPDPELLGCFGVGILAKQKFHDGIIEKGSFEIDEILNTKIVYEREFALQGLRQRLPDPRPQRERPQVHVRRPLQQVRQHAEKEKHR